jgi:hypothetical protein
VWFVASCATTGSPPAQPVHAAPEPVQPATGLALLVQERASLKLTETQTQRLEALDEALGERNAPLERELTTLEAAAAKRGDSEEAPRAGGPRGGGGRMGMGGRGRRGMGGAPSGAPGGQPAGRQRPAEGRPHGGTERADVLRAEMAKNHAAALHDAFEVLDETQRQRARHVLEENDFEPPP